MIHDTSTGIRHSATDQHAEMTIEHAEMESCLSSRPWPAVGMIAVVQAVVLAAVLMISHQSRADDPVPMPSAEYSPQQVVRIVVDSLQDNDNEDDAGIATVFRFASPGNKANTGPLPRFTHMIKRGFPDMLNHAGARFDPMEISGDVAMQAVWLMTPSGKEQGYAFQLSRQHGGEFDGVWMTDAVLPLGPGPRSGVRI